MPLPESQANQRLPLYFFALIKVEAILPGQELV